MRIILRIDDALLSDARQLALDRGRTLTETVEDALRVYLAQQQSKQASKQPFQLDVVGGTGLQPGVDLSSNAALADLIER